MKGPSREKKYFGEEPTEANRAWRIFTTLDEVARKRVAERDWYIYILILHDGFSAARSL